MKLYLGQCVIAFAFMAYAYVVVNAIPLPSHGDSELAAPQIPSSFADLSFLPIDAPGELNDKYDLPSVQTTSIANIGSTESSSTITPSSQSATEDDTAPYRVNKKDFSLEDAKALITRMLTEQLKERSQYPWNKDGEWSDQVLRTVIQSMHTWQRNAVQHDLRRQAQVSNSSSEPTGHRILPSATKRTAASNQLNRSQLNSHMDTLWTWAIRQKASLANLKRLSAQKKLSKFYQDPERYPIPAKQMMAVLLTSIPAYNPSRPNDNDMSKMPWHGTKGTFQWKDPDDLKKVLSHVRKLSRMGTWKRNEFIQLLNNGSREVLVAKMDEAWKKWVNERLRTKIIHHRYRVANREAKATSSPLPGKE